jgi:hypothetical protein
MSRPVRRFVAAASTLVLVGALGTCECAPPAPGPPAPLPLDTVLGPGEVRCGPVTKASELIGGPVAYGQVGRAFRCHNARVRFLLQDGSRPAGNSVEGGNIIDIDRVRPDELADGNDTFREMVSALGALEVRVESIEVRNDGADGRPGVLRVRGRPTALSLAPQAAFLSQDLQGEIVTDYTLAPDSDVIQIDTTFFNEGDTVFGALGADFVAIGGATPVVAPEFGFGEAPSFGRVTFLAGARGGDVNVGYVCDGRDATIPLVDAGITVPLCNDELIIGAEGGFRRFLIVGDGTVDSVARQAWRLRDIATGEVAGAVASAVAGTLVSALSAPLSSSDSHVVNEARVVDGRFRLALPPGDYTLVAHAPLLTGAQVARSAEVAVTVAAGQESAVALALGGQGRLEVTTRFDDDVVRPAKLTIVPVDDTPRANAVLGELSGSGVVRTEGSADGRFAVDVPVGRYDVYVTRGFEFTRFAQRVDVAAGGAVVVDAELARALDTTGALGGEFHQHSLGSIDAAVPVPRKVLENATEGVEIAVSTDHDNVVDYRPFVDALGLSAHVVAFAGNEVSYQAIGHFNAWPWALDPADPLRDVGSRLWWGKTLPELFDDIRAGGGPDTLVQLNHPRSNGAGVLAAMLFDPTTGRRLPRDPPRLPTLPPRVYEAWSPDFDAIEVNTDLGDPALFTAEGAAELARRADDDSTSVPVLADWFGLMGAGLPVAAMGNSDTHGVNEGVGYPRTFLFVDAAGGSDDPTALTAAQLQQTVRAQRTAIAQGCLLTLTIDGSPRMGHLDVVAVADARRARVRLQAPPHVGVGRLEVYVNGRVQRLAFDGATFGVDAAGPLSLPVADIAGVEPAARLDHPVAGLPLDVDSVVVAVSRGGQGLAPTGGGETLCVSPPLYVDADGDGRVTPWLSGTEQVTARVP